MSAPVVTRSRARFRAYRTDHVRELKLTTLANGDEHALWRFVGAKDPTWHSLHVSRARAALRVGRGVFGGWDGPVIAHVEEVKA